MLRGVSFELQDSPCFITPAWNPIGTQFGMPQLLIMDKVLERADPRRSPNGRLEIWDTYLPDFGYRATQLGRGSFFVMFRLAGQRRRMTIGRYPIMSLS